MTSSAFNSLLNQKYVEALATVYNPDDVKKRLGKFTDENGKLSADIVSAEVLLLAAEFSKELIGLLLPEVLELSD